MALFLVVAIGSNFKKIAGGCERKSSFTELFAIDRTQRSAAQMVLQRLDVR
ncbi:hypothetical protein [Bradyrhizobium sp. ARR65]|uniref:hypothetical protein n=1 Tax=Bradyrhizobium sp. ARR65 TaxID=1040989 RepID=UPI000AE4C2B4|nr:hypothetical protein [Bradyrhizobium sp. ARR65]